MIPSPTMIVFPGYSPPGPPRVCPPVSDHAHTASTPPRSVRIRSANSRGHGDQHDPLHTLTAQRAHRAGRICADAVGEQQRRNWPVIDFHENQRPVQIRAPLSPVSPAGFGPTRIHCGLPTRTAGRRPRPRYHPWTSVAEAGRRTAMLRPAAFTTARGHDVPDTCSKLAARPITWRFVDVRCGQNMDDFRDDRRSSTGSGRTAGSGRPPAAQRPPALHDHSSLGALRDPPMIAIGTAAVGTMGGHHQYGDRRHGQSLYRHAKPAIASQGTNQNANRSARRTTARPVWA